MHTRLRVIFICIPSFRSSVLRCYSYPENKARKYCLVCDFGSYGFQLQGPKSYTSSQVISQSLVASQLNSCMQVKTKWVRKKRHIACINVSLNTRSWKKVCDSHTPHADTLPSKRNAAASETLQCFRWCCISFDHQYTLLLYKVHAIQPNTVSYSTSNTKWVSFFRYNRIAY